MDRIKNILVRIVLNANIAAKSVAWCAVAKNPPAPAKPVAVHAPHQNDDLILDPIFIGFYPISPHNLL